MNDVIYLDGNDWEADYFLPEQQYFKWTGVHRTIFNMFRNSAQSAGFVSGDVAPGAMTGTVPGCDRSFLIENGQCEDPFYARNLEHTVYAENYSWAFRKRFTLPKEWQGRKIQLDFKGLDYKAVIFLNGQWIDLHTGQCVPKSTDITQFVKFGEENLLALVFDEAPKGSPDHRNHEPADFAYFHRTNIGFGWDWSRGIVPQGIWDSVILTAYDRTLLTGRQLLFDGEKALVKLEIESRKDAANVPLKCCLKPRNFEGKSTEFAAELTLDAGENFYTFEMPLPDDLQLWYPVGYGSQPLYTLEIMLDDTPYTLNTGFKTIKMVRNPDSPRGANNLTYNINGKDVFVRGLNYVPEDLIISRATDKDYDHLVKTAAMAGFNYFRNWGGSLIEKDAFYDACDRYGVMVHQEFMHGCTNAPKDEEFLAFKRIECRQILKKLANYVCITLICGGNESQYYGEIPNSPMFEDYRKAVEEILPYTPFRVTSPDLSRPGERHHGPWHFCEHGFWNTHFRQFASEVGCNAMPEFSSLKRFIPQREIEAMKGPALEYHFYNRVNVYDLSKPLVRFAPEVLKDMEKFCKASMFAQADAARYVYEHYRRLFPLASGVVFWQYNEPWPTCSFNLLDYYGVPKQAIYTMKQANATTLLSFEDDSWCCADKVLKAKWYITADNGFTGKAAYKAFDCATGRELFAGEVSGTYGENSTLLGEVDENLPDGITAVFFYLDGVCTSVRYYGVPDYQAAFELPRTTLEIKREGNFITVANTGKSVAVNVKLEFNGLPDKTVIFTDNYLGIEPGASRTVEFYGDAGDAELTVTGWNC